MGIIEFFDRLRAKPTSTRRTITLVATVILWFLIVSVWWIAVNTTTSTREFVSISEVISPWKALKKTFSGAKEDATGMVSEILKSVATGTETIGATPVEAELPRATDTAVVDTDVEWSGGAPKATGTATVTESISESIPETGEDVLQERTETN
jgi:hypothetical protein